MAHVFEEAQLSVGALGKQLRLEGPVQLLDGHLVASAAVYCRAQKLLGQLLSGGWGDEG